MKFSLSCIRITKGHECWAILFLWGYDLVKFWLVGDILAGLCIDPVRFLFFDMVTVPPFIIGLSRLVNALAGAAMAWPRVLGWGLIVLVNTLVPYGYAAIAGKAGFTREVWALFWCLVGLVLANLIRTIHCQVLRQKREGQGPD